MRTTEVHFDVEGVKSLLAANSNIEVSDNAGNYSDEWLTKLYMENVFKGIEGLIKDYYTNVHSVSYAANFYQNISELKIPDSISDLLKLLSVKLNTTGTGTGPTPPGKRQSHGENPDKPDEENDETPGENPDENPDQEQEQNPEQENPTVENEVLIAASVGAIAFQTPMTIYSTIGGEGIQTSSETEYGLLGIENVDGNMYYKLIDKKTGNIYYAKVEETNINEDIQLLHVKENALILNSTDIGSDDNFVKLANSDSYYVITDKQDVNGVSFATILDSNDGKSYYVPVSESVEVLSINQLESSDSNTNTDVIVEDSSNVDSNESINNSDFYSDDDIDITFDEVDSLDESNLNTEILDDSNNLISDDSDLEFSDSNYVSEDLINDPKYYEDSDILDYNK